MSTLAELMELADIPTVDDYGADVPQLHTSTRNHGVVKNELDDLDDIEEEEGERKKLIDSLFQSGASDRSLQPERQLQQLQPDPSTVPLAGVDTSYAPRPLVSPPTHLQMDEPARMRVFGRKFIGPMPENLVRCHRCEAPMRICVRKLRYVDHIKEYPSYRCTRKGCQTFKSLRIVEHPEMARAPRVVRVVRLKPATRQLQLQLQQQKQKAQGGFTMQLRPRPQPAHDFVPLPNPYAAYASAARRVNYVAAPPAHQQPRPMQQLLQLAKLPTALQQPLQQSSQLQPLHDPYRSQTAHFSAARNLLMGVPMGGGSMMQRGGGGGDRGEGRRMDGGGGGRGTLSIFSPVSPMMSPRRTPMSAALAPLRATRAPTPAPRQQAPPARKRSRYEQCTKEQQDTVMALLLQYNEELQRSGDALEEPVPRHTRRVRKPETPRSEEPDPAIAAHQVRLQPAPVSPPPICSTPVLPAISVPPRNSSPILLSPSSTPSPPAPYRSALPSIFPPASSSSMTMMKTMRTMTPMDNPLDRWMQQHHVQPRQLQQQQAAPTAPQPPRVLTRAQTRAALEQIQSAARTLAAINLLTRGGTAQSGFANPLFSRFNAPPQQQLQSPTSAAQHLQQEEDEILSPSPTETWDFPEEDEEESMESSHMGLHGAEMDDDVIILEDNESEMAYETHRDDAHSSTFDEYNEGEYDAEFAMELNQRSM